MCAQYTCHGSTSTKIYSVALSRSDIEFQATVLEIPRVHQKYAATDSILTTADELVSPHYQRTAIGLVLPQLKGKLHGLSLRVPTSTVSVVDLVVNLEKPASVETVNDALRSAAHGNLSDILVYCDEPLVSSIFRGNAASSIVDGPSTVVMEGKHPRLIELSIGCPTRTMELILIV
jgi:hypothetical protein